MRKRSLGKNAIILLGLAVLAWPVSAAPTAGKGARVKFSELAWHFGKVKQNEVLNHEFVFKNIGDGTLEVKKVSTSCGCTAALVSEKKVEPGEEGRIKADFDTRGYSGEVSKYIYFESNDAADPRLELKISATVEVAPQPKIDLDRYNIDMGLCLEGEPSRASFTIRNTGELELRVDISHPELSFYSAGKEMGFPVKIAAGRSMDVEVRFPTKQAKTGLVREYVLVKSNDAVRSTLSIYLSRYVITKEALKEFLAGHKAILAEP